MNLEQGEKQRLLEYMAGRAATDDHAEFFLARAIRAYQQAHHLDRAALITWLDIRPEQLTLLELCRRPSQAEGQERYQQGIETIAAKFEIDREKLTVIIENKAN